MSNKPRLPVNKKALVALYREALTSGVDIEKLKEKIEKMASKATIVKKIEKKQEKQRKERINNSIPKTIRFGAFLLPLTFLGVGIFLISSAIMPISSYYLETLPTLNIFDLKTPIPRESVLDITPAVIAQASTITDIEIEEAQKKSKPIILDTKLDYTNLANWFNDEITENLDTNQSLKYSLEIPKLNIFNADVAMSGTNLNKSLIQYPDTADPGKPGAPVIFGHSVLRQFYNPSEKNARRYISIFSKIMTLKNGDEIFIKKDGIKYTYKVSNKTEVKPDDVYILTQNYDVKTLKLVTCVPEGTYLRRGIITATLVK